MSAPKTNLDKQRRRHWAPLLGVALVTLFGVGATLYWLMEEVRNAPAPDTDPSSKPVPPS